MSKFVIYSKRDGQVWNILDQYTIEPDGTLAGGFNGVNTLRYHVSTNPQVLEITDEQYNALNINNLDKYVVVENILAEKPDSEDYQVGKSVLEDKIIRLDIDCTNTIYNGTDITLSDDNTYHFSLSDKDQANLTSLSLELLAGATQVEWHTDNHDDPCKYYSAEDANTIIRTLTFHKKYHITYFRDLRRYVSSLTSNEEIMAIEYGFAIPEEFKSDVLKGYEATITATSEE